MSLLADAFAALNRGKLVYADKTHTGDRQGGSLSSYGRLDIKHSVSGAPGASTNPEQLLAAGWSACFEAAMAVAACKRKIRLPADTAIDVEVDLPNNTYFFRARISVSLPGLDRELALAIVNEAHQICPYSHATRGNIDTAIYLV